MASGFVQKSKNILFSLYSLAVSAVMLYFCSACSPRYALNPWVDSNAFFTVGKAMANGSIVYKDIFEQKGPLLYLLHAIAYHISKTSFLGVYFIEVIFFAVTLFFVFKITSLYCKDEIALITIPAFAGITLNTMGFYLGDSAEEFCITFLMISLYFMMKFLRDENKELHWWVLVLNGFLAGCVAMIKFTLIGFWFGWMAFIALYLLFSKKTKNAVIYSLYFLAGMGAGIGIWVIYFLCKGALKDFINVYFIINSTAYSNIDASLFKQTIYTIFNYGGILLYSPVAFSLVFIGALLPLIVGTFTDKKFTSRIAIPFIYAVGVFFAYWGGRYISYYFFIFNVFSIFVFIGLGMAISKLIKNPKILKSMCCIIGVAAIAFGVFVSVKYSQSSLTVERDIKSTPQYKISQYISNHNPNGKLLVYNSLDCGAYLLNDITPDFRYFEKQNIDPKKFSENMDEQNRYINENLAYYVVCRGQKSVEEDCYQNNEALRKDYNLVLSINGRLATQRKRGKCDEMTYYLFELKD